MSLNELLMDAVTYHRVDEVKELLRQGADANHFHSYGARDEDNEGQPTTPLQMVVFCISDCMLDDDGLNQFAEVAKLLIKHGANPKPAMALAEIRYGKYKQVAEPDPFMKVWDIVANAMK